MLALLLSIILVFPLAVSALETGESGGAIGSPLPREATSAEMMQREIDRRREQAFQLNEILGLADRLHRSGEWDHAETKYNLVLLETNPQDQTAGFYQRAQIGKARCLAAKALAKEEEGNLVEAAGLWKQASDLDPANKAVARKAANLREAGARQADPYPDNGAVTEELLQKTSEIKRLLSLADQQTETGQLVEARKSLDDVLRLDPYHRVARKKIELLEEKRMVAADLRYLSSREKALAKVSEAWLPPPPAKIDPSKIRQTGAAGGFPSGGNHEKAGGNQDSGTDLQ